jgi:hypothetical protein
MKMPTFDSLDKLFAHIQKQVTESLKTDVADDAKELLKENKQTEVYDAYTPYSTDGITPHYERTYQLLNSNESKMIDENTLEITSPRGTDSETGVDIAYAVEKGGNYTWGYTRDLNEEMGAREFMGKTKNDLENGKLRESMKKALELRFGKGNVI